MFFGNQYVQRWWLSQTTKLTILQSFTGKLKLTYSELFFSAEKHASNLQFSTAAQRAGISTSFNNLCLTTISFSAWNVSDIASLRHTPRVCLLYVIDYVNCWWVIQLLLLCYPTFIIIDCVIWNCYFSKTYEGIWLEETLATLNVLQDWSSYRNIGTSSMGTDLSNTKYKFWWWLGFLSNII